MKHIIPLLFLLFSMACATDKQSVKESPETAQKNISQMLDETFGSNTQANNSTPNQNLNAEEIQKTFNVSFYLDKAKDQQYTFGVELKLDNESYVISPFSNDDFYGPFLISMEDSSNLIPVDELAEIPQSIEEFDSIIEKPVRVIRENTRFNQNVKVLNSEDFEVPGSVWFVLEPSCIPFQVDFVLSQRSGKLEVTKTKTATAYKGSKL